MKFLKTPFFFLMLVVLPTITQAKVVDLFNSAKLKKTVVSGVLSPASVSVNGNEVFQSNNESYEALLINGTEAKTTDVGGLITFYEVAEGDKIELKWLRKDGSTQNIISLAYPAVTDMKFEHDRLLISFNELTKSAKFNTQVLNVPQAQVPVSSVKQWFSEPHTLELTSTDKVSQIYNLDFSDYQKEMLTDVSWSFYFGDPPFSGNQKPLMIGAGARVSDETGISKEIAMVLGKVFWRSGDSFSGSEVSQEAVQIKYRHAYSPFEFEPTGFSYKRWSFGAFAEIVNYKRDSPYEMSFDGYNQKFVDVWYLQGGFSFRFEPYRYKDYGVCLQFDVQMAKTSVAFSSDKDMKYIGLTYYFDSATMKRLGMKQP